MTSRGRAGSAPARSAGTLTGLRQGIWTFGAKAYGYGHDLVIRLKEQKRVREHPGLPETGRQAMRRLHGAARLAGFVIHPRYVDFSIRHAIRALAASGFRIAALASEPVPEDLAAFIRDHGGEIVPRQRIGHDVGAYRDFMTYLHEQSDAFPDLDWVVLLNDSVYWTSEATGQLRSLLEGSPRWACVTESFVPRYHAQSYLICLSRDVAFSEVCRNYWLNYQPFSYRRHVIQNGEIGFSNLLARTFGKPRCLLSGGTIARLLHDMADDGDGAAASDLRVACWIDMQAGDSAWWRVSELSDPDGRERLSASAARYLRTTYLREISQVAMTSNPTHSLCLTLSHLCQAPVKRDLVWRGTHPIGFVPLAVQGYSDEERVEIEHDLRSRGLPSDLSVLDRMLVTTGRR